MLAPTCSAAHKGEPGEQKRFVCVPGQDAAVYWHPYKLVDEPRMNGRLSCPLVQRRLADLGHSIPEMLPAPTAQLLHVVTLAGERVHEISPATIPSIGLTLEGARCSRGTCAAVLGCGYAGSASPFLAPPGK